MANIKQSKHSTESEARSAARALGKTHCFIIESIVGNYNELPRIKCFYLESGAEAGGLIRFYESCIYQGEGRRA
jgi:hypothetical protein